MMIQYVARQIIKTGSIKPPVYLTITVLNHPDSLQNPVRVLYYFSNNIFLEWLELSEVNMTMYVPDDNPSPLNSTE